MGAPRRIAAGIYEVNGRRINAPTGAAAQAMYNKKYPPAAAQPPAAQPPPAAVAPGAPPPVDPNLAVGGQALASIGGNSAGFTGTDPALANRNQVEQDVYAGLTQGYGDRFANENTQAEQTLYNRGITFNADPKSQYQQQYGELQNQHNNAYLAAGRQATEIGGNQYLGYQNLSQQEKERQQQLAIAQLGAKTNIQTAKIAANKRTGGGGGSSTSNSPFNL